MLPWVLLYQQNGRMAELGERIQGLNPKNESRGGGSFLMKRKTTLKESATADRCDV